MHDRKDSDRARGGWLKADVGTKRAWIRSVRLQQNMLSKQLAEKMHVSPARVSVMEKDEQRGAVTLKMMQKAAAALGCQFVYALVPNTGMPRNVQRPAKPKIRLDSMHMKEDSTRQVHDLLLEYERSMFENGDS